MRILRYRAYPAFIPQSVWDIAKSQRDLWNKLVVLAGHHSEWARLIGDKKSSWAGFDDTARAIVKASGLDWVNGPEVLDRLRTTFRKKCFPKFHGTLNRVALLHRFTSGGIALGRLIDKSKAKRFALQSSSHWQLPKRAHSPGKRHWRGCFRAGDETIDFSLALHRALPTDAILKRVQWLGERSGTKWFWHLALTIEEPPIESPYHSSQLSAGLDLGWRSFAEGSPNDYVRVGMLADSEGRTVEFRLPLLLRNGPGGERRTIVYLAELQSLADEFLNCGRELTGDKRLGPRGLRDLIAAGHQHAEGIGAALAAHDLLRKRLNEQRFHLLQRRNWWYQNLAQWLCQRYARIAIEADMKLAKLHERSKDPALRNAAIYRNYAAVGELRKRLMATAGKTGTRIDGETAYSTITCWVCGKEMLPSANLMLTCPNGHQLDQDKNAAMNLLSQIDGTFGQAHELRRPSWPGGWTMLEMPQQIRAVAVEVPPGSGVKRYVQALHPGTLNQ